MAKRAKRPALPKPKGTMPKGVKARMPTMPMPPMAGGKMRMPGRMPPAL